MATASLLKANPYLLPVYWLVGAGDVDTAKRFRDRIRAPHKQITIIRIDDTIFSGWREGGHISRAAYIRLLIPAVVKAPRALYLDCDLLVTSDIRPLLTMELGEKWFAGLVDLYFTGARGTRQPFPKYCADAYLNSGVLLMNLEALRTANFIKLAIDTYHASYRRIFTHDQCIINLRAEGRKMALDARWNLQIRPLQTTETQWNDILNNGQVAILHFADAVKPWQKWCADWIARTWKAAADEVGLEERYYEAALTISKAAVLANAMHRAQQFEQASALRGRIIKALMPTPSKPGTVSKPPVGKAQ